MTKEEFLKKALGSQYSEKEAEKGLLDLDALRRTAKNNLGSQFTESEFNTMMGVEKPMGIMDLNEVELNKLRRIKEQMGGQVTEKEAMAMIRPTDAYGEPIPELDVADLRRQFSSILSSITPQEQENVLKHWQMSDDNGKVEFMKWIVDKPERATGYGIQDEVLLPKEANLGLGGSQTQTAGTNNTYYDDVLGIYLPMSYQRMGGTGDERFRQGSAGWGFDSYPHSAPRNYYGAKMRDADERYRPLVLG